MDQILGLILLSSHNEAHDDDNVTALIPGILDKGKALLQLYEKTGEVGSLSKGIRKVLVSLGQLQAAQPLGMKDSLADYLSLLETVIRHHRQVSEESVKGGLLGLIKVLKTFVYYSDSQSFLAGRSASKLKNFHEQQVRCTAMYNTFFSAQKIEQLFFSLLYELLPRHLVDNEGMASVETEIDNTLDETVAEMDNSTQRLVLCLVDLLFNRFEAASLHILSQIQNTLETQALGVQDSVLTVLCLVPRIYERNYNKDTQNIHSDQIRPTLQWLHAQLQLAPTPVYLRSLPMLVTRWMRLLPLETQVDCFAMVVSLLASWNDSMDLTGVYQCCMCLRALLCRKELVPHLSESLPQLVPAVLPVVLHLFGHTDLPTVLYPLISLLTLSLEVTQRTVQPEVLACFNQQKTLDTLLLSSNEMVKESLVDMIKNLLTLFPPETPIP